MPRTDPPVIAAIFEGILIIQFVQPFSTLHERKFSAKTNFLFSVMFIQSTSGPENEDIHYNPIDHYTRYLSRLVEDLPFPPFHFRVRFLHFVFRSHLCLEGMIPSPASSPFGNNFRAWREYSD